MILRRQSENCGPAEVKVFGGLGGRQRPWLLIGALRRQIALMTVLCGAQALWPLLAVNYSWRREGARNAVRTGGTESLRHLRAHLRRWYWSPDDLSTDIRTQYFCDIANMSEHRGALRNKLYFSEPAKIVFSLVNDISFKPINFGQRPNSFLLTWPHFPCISYH